jgi:hypothetical protein
MKIHLLIMSNNTKLKKVYVMQQIFSMLLTPNNIVQQATRCIPYDKPKAYCNRRTPKCPQKRLLLPIQCRVTLTSY